MNDTTFSGNGKVSFIPVITNADPKPMSNGDKIRAKSDYDLADWIAQVLMYHGSFSSRPLTWVDTDCDGKRNGRQEAITTKSDKDG